jgi:hypothetical protein
MIALDDRRGDTHYFEKEDIVKIFQEKSGSIKVSLISGAFVRCNAGLSEIVEHCEIPLLEFRNTDRNLEFINPKLVTLVHTTESGGTRICFYDGQYIFTWRKSDEVREEIENF